MMKTTSLLTAGLLLLVLAAPTNAAHHECKQGHHGPGKPTFAQVDADGDGGISEQELMEFRGKRMAEKAKEGRQLKNAAKAPAFADIDSNGDGAISEEEFAAHQAEHKCSCGGRHGKGRDGDMKQGGCRKEQAEEA